MENDNLKNRFNLSGKLAREYDHLKRLINELEKRAPGKETIDLIREELQPLNELSDGTSEKELHKTMEKSKNALLQKVEKKLRLVPRHYYRNLWLILGMSAFGIPMGVIFGMLLDNMALFALGFPIGMAIGMGYGIHLDQKARDEGRQLDIEMNVN